MPSYSPLEVQSPETAAREDAFHVKETFEQEGARAAYARLMEDQASHGCFGPHQKKAYLSELTRQLSTDDNGQGPVLPKLSVAYLEQTYGSLTCDSGRLLSTYRLQDRALTAMQIQDSERRMGIDLGSNPLEAAFLRDLYSRSYWLEKDAAAIDRRPGLSRTDVSMYLDAEQRQKIQHREFLARADRNQFLANVLLENGGGFFNVLDGFNGNNNLDGNIQLGDVRKFNRRVMFDHDFSSRFSPDQIDAGKQMETLLSDRNARRENGSIVTDNGWGYNRITRESIAKGLGHYWGKQLEATSYPRNADTSRVQVRFGPDRVPVYVMPSAAQPERIESAQPQRSTFSSWENTVQQRFDTARTAPAQPVSEIPQERVMTSEPTQPELHPELQPATIQPPEQTRDLGQLLIEKGVCSKKQIELAMKFQQAECEAGLPRRELSDILCGLRYCSAEQIAMASK